MFSDLRRYVFLLVVLLSALWTGCGSEEPASLVVTSAMLEQAALDVRGDLAEPKVVSLMPPGACPGHFDLSPRVLPAIQSAGLVLRHDYQAGLDGKFEQIGAGDVRPVVIETPNSLLIPDNYLAIQGRITDALAERFPERGEALRRNLEANQRGLDALAGRLRKQAEPWQGRAVIVSWHQKEFCQWLGLNVVGGLDRPEDITPRELEDLVGLKAEAVVANLQEGTQAAEAIAEKLDLPLVVLSNFPNTPGYGEGYEALLTQNLDRLNTALGPQLTGR
ncbi:zinc ABC transporter substrate-binding protein [bacterium]|nr:zinc ABC transporter substrate-binding protein [bacterium]